MSFELFWSDKQVESLLEIFDENLDYNITDCGLPLCGHISNLLLNLYGIDRSDHSILKQIRLMKKRYKDLTQAWKRGKLTRRTWPYYDQLHLLYNRHYDQDYPLATLSKTLGPSNNSHLPLTTKHFGWAFNVAQDEKFQLSPLNDQVITCPQLSPTMTLTPEDHWTVRELDCLLTIFENEKSYKFYRPHLWLAKKILDQLIGQFGIDRFTAIQVQSKIKKLNRKVSRFVTPTTLQLKYPYYGRIYSLHNRM